MVRLGFRCRGWAAVQSVVVLDHGQPRCRAEVARLLLTTAIVTVGFTLASSEAGAVTGCSGTTTITCTSSGNPYASGIPYTTNTLDLSLIVQGDVVVNSTATGVQIGNTDTDNDIVIDLYSGALIATTGASKHGVRVDDAASIYINSSAQITTSGSDAEGVFIDDTLGNVTVITTGDITTYGTKSRGIRVSDTTVNVTVTSSSNITTKSNVSASYGSGIWVSGSGDVSVTSTGDIETYGGRSRGILVTDSGEVTVNSSGDITTHYNSNNSTGILMVRNDSVDVTSTGTITTAGSKGIEVNQTYGDVSVTVLGDIVAGTSFTGVPTTNSYARGIEIDNSDGVVGVYLSNDSSITTYGGYADGVFIDETGDGVGTDQVSVRAEGTVVTSGIRSHGIYVNDTAGNVDVSASGIITTNGDASHGIYVKDTTGNVTVDVAGTVTATGSNSDGISLSNASGTVKVDISGTVSGGSGTGAGLRLSSLDSTATPTVAIRGTLGALSDIALVDANDAVTINNSGAITGIVSLGGGDDIFNNESGGTWNLRSGDNSAIADFGSGTDSVMNSGTLRLLKGFQPNWQGSLTNLESFTNSGSIDLADGHAGDTLSISGNFVSDGGSLRLDTVLDDGAPPQTDTLQLNTVTTASGPTHIQIENAGGQGAQTSGNGIQIIDVATSSAENAFDLTDRLILGAYEYNLVQAGEDWYLRSGVFEGTTEYPAIVSGAMLAWQADLGFLHNRLRGPSWESGDGKPRIEPVAWKGNTDQKIGPWFNVLGARQNISSDAAYKQNITKFDAGLDGEIETGRSRILLGAFAGAGQHEQDFTDSTSKTTTDSITAGAYGKYRWGGFYGDGIFKYEHHFADFSGAATDNEQTAFDLDLLGLSLGTGYRFTGRHFYVQPNAGVDYVHAKADSFEDVSGATINLSNGDSLAGELGARIGAAVLHAELYLDAGVSHEFLGETQAEVSGLAFSNDLPGTVGLVSAGLTTRAAEDKLLLTLETGYAKGPEAEEFTATGSFWLKF